MAPEETRHQHQASGGASSTPAAPQGVIRAGSIEEQQAAEKRAHEAREAAAAPHLAAELKAARERIAELEKQRTGPPAPDYAKMTMHELGAALINELSNLHGNPAPLEAITSVLKERLEPGGEERERDRSSSGGRPESGRN